MKKKIIISASVALLLGIFVVTFQFICPLIVIECAYTLDSVTMSELKTYGADAGSPSEDYLKLRIYFTLINMTAFEPEWEAVDIETSAEYTGRILGGSKRQLPEDANRFSNNTYSIQVIINIKGLSDEEIISFVESITVRANKDTSTAKYKNNYNTPLFEFVIADKLNEKS